MHNQLYTRNGNWYTPVTDIVAYHRDTADIHVAWGWPSVRTVPLDSLIAVPADSIRKLEHVGTVNAELYVDYEARCVCGYSSTHPGKDTAATALRAHRASLGLEDHPKAVIM